MADAATGSDATDDGQHDVFRGDAGGQSAVHFHTHPLGSTLGQRLRGQHVLDLAGADAEGQCAECAVGGGVAVAAHDGHAGKRAPLFRSDHVNDSLLWIAHREQRHAELLGVVAHHFHLAGRDGVGDGQVNVGRRNVVVLGGHGEIGSADFAATHAQAIEGLRAGDFMDEMQIDVQQVGLAGGGVDDVHVPDLLGECGGGGHNAPSLSERERDDNVDGLRRWLCGTPVGHERIHLHIRRPRIPGRAFVVGCRIHGPLGRRHGST